MNSLQAHAIEKVNEICDRHIKKPTPLILILNDIQNEFGYIPLPVQQIVSDRTGIALSEIYGVVTFYSYFSMEPKGKYVIGVCLGTACYVKGAQQILDRFCDILNIRPGQTTPDGLFTIDSLRCIGACGIAPAISLNGSVIPKVSTNQVPQIIAQCMGEEEKA